MKDESKRLYERALITCVVMLLVCIVFKLFGATWFDLNTDFPILNKIDEVVMSSETYSFIYSFFLKSINVYLVYIITVKKKEVNIPAFVVSVIFCLLNARVFTGNPMSLVIDTLIVLRLCLENGNKHVIKEYFLVVILNILYQLLSLYLKDIAIGLTTYNFVENILFSLDYYILLLITYLYLKKGDVTLCGVMVHFGSFLRKKLCTMRSELLNHFSNKKEG